MRNKRYTLYEVMLCLKHWIKEEHLYDPENPSIIMTNLALENALEVRAIHVSNVRDYVLKQMIQDIDIMPPRVRNTFRTLTNIIDELHRRATARAANQQQYPTAQQRAEIDRLNQPEVMQSALPDWANPNCKLTEYRSKMIRSFDIEGEYTVDSEFLKILLTTQTDKTPKDKYKYRDITRWFSEYILANKTSLFDMRNIRVMIIKGTPLEKVFKVSAIDRSQVTTFLRAFIHPIPINLSTTERVEPTFNIQRAHSTAEINTAETLIDMSRCRCNSH